MRSLFIFILLVVVSSDLFGQLWLDSIYYTNLDPIYYRYRNKTIKNFKCSIDSSDLHRFNRTDQNFKKLFPNVEIDSCNLTGQAVFSLSAPTTMLRVRNSKAGTIYSLFTENQFISDTIQMLMIQGSTLTSRDTLVVDINSSRITQVMVSHAVIPYLSVFETNINYLYFGGLEILTPSIIHLSTIDTLVFDNVDLPVGIDLNLSDALDLGITSDPDHITYVCFLHTDISKVDIRFYQNVKLYFPNRWLMPKQDKERIYQDLLNNFKTKGLTDNFEKLDKEFKEFKYLNDAKYKFASTAGYGGLINWIDRIWWDYGYNKYRVIWNAFLLQLIFFAINLSIYDKLISHVYKLEKFAKINGEHNLNYFDNPKKMFWVKFPYIFLYTSYIFWGWKLDMTSLNVSRIWLFVYVLFQYLVGVVCLAYLANLIVTIKV